MASITHSIKYCQIQFSIVVVKKIDFILVTI